MAKFNLIINKIKSDRSLQLKIALFSVVIILLYLHFKDIDNKYVNLISKEINRKSFDTIILTQKYCPEFYASSTKLLSERPMVLECVSYDTKLTKANHIITNGEWIYDVKKTEIIVGTGEKYILLNNCSTIDKVTGEMSKNKILRLPEHDKELERRVARSGQKKRNNYGSVRLYRPSTVSNNMRFFVSNFFNGIIQEIGLDGEITHIIKVQDYWSNLYTRMHISSIVSSDDGNYLFVLVKDTKYGWVFPPGLKLLIIDVKDKAVIYKKTFISSSMFVASKLQIKSNEVSFILYNNKKVKKHIINFDLLKKVRR